MNLDKPTISKIVSILVTAAIALAAVFGYDVIVDQPREQTAVSTAVMNAGPPMATDEASHFSNLNVAGTATFAGTSSFAGAATFATAPTFAAGATLSRGLILSSTTITPTAGQTITPAYDVYVIGATAAVSMTLAACSNTGRIVTFIGEDNYNITINDANIFSHDGNAEIFAQYDVSQWICVGTKWHQLGLASADS